jgi:hypothetical protein
MIKEKFSLISTEDEKVIEDIGGCFELSENYLKRVWEGIRETEDEEIGMPVQSYVKATSFMLRKSICTIEVRARNEGEYWALYIGNNSDSLTTYFKNETEALGMAEKILNWL